MNITDNTDEPTAAMVAAMVRRLLLNKPDGSAWEDVVRLAYLDARALAAPVTEVAAWVNSDELNNMLDDRTATIQGKRDGWRGTPLYRGPAIATQPAESKACASDARVIETARTEGASYRPWETTVRIEGDALTALMEQIGDKDECYEITLAIGIAQDEDGKEERGLYCWQNEYPSESLVLIKELPAIRAPAAAVPESPAAEAKKIEGDA